MAKRFNNLGYEWLAALIIACIVSLLPLAIGIIASPF